jgi:Domain of unknown function (DUF4416)
MAEPRLPDPVLLVVAVFSRHLEVLAWASERLEELYGPISLTSTEYEFLHTAYYEATMGACLRKRFLAFHNLVAADCLPTFKLQTNGLERELARTTRYVEPRPLNLDPGLLSLGKFVLATTKDQAHRIYLREGIFAEVTLRFEAGAFEPWPWTYADYRELSVRAFLKEARDFYRRRLKSVRRNAGDPGGARPPQHS